MTTVAAKFWFNLFANRRESMTHPVKTVLLVFVVLGVHWADVISGDNAEIESDLLGKRQQECIDKYVAAAGEPNCAIWAAAGECEVNPIWMYPYCQKSCDLCNCWDKEADCADRAYQGDCTESTTKQWMKENCPLSCATCEGKCLDGISAWNTYNDNNCKVWSMCGYCTNPTYPYRQFVLDRCPKSCALCTNDPIETAPATCQDWLSTENFCIPAANSGDCSQPFYMMGCLKTCGGCEWLRTKHDNQCAFTACGQWKIEGYCDSDPCFMDRFCGPVCQVGECKNSKNLPASGPQPCTVTGTCVEKQRRQK